MCGGKGLRLMLRTAKMLVTKEWLPSRHLVPGAADFRFASVPPQGSGVGKRSEARPSGRRRGRSAEPAALFTCASHAHPTLKLWVPGGGKGSRSPPSNPLVLCSSGLRGDPKAIYKDRRVAVAFCETPTPTPRERAVRSGSTVAVAVVGALVFLTLR